MVQYCEICINLVTSIIQVGDLLTLLKISMKKSLLIMLALVVGMTAIAYSGTPEQEKSAEETQEKWYNVSGYVKDECGVPMIGVDVTVVGTSLATITNFDGAYTFSPTLIREGAQLKFSYIGYKDKYVTVYASHIDDVYMEPQN